MPRQHHAGRISAAGSSVCSPPFRVLCSNHSFFHVRTNFSRPCKLNRMFRVLSETSSFFFFFQEQKTQPTSNLAIFCLSVMYCWALRWTKLIFSDRYFLSFASEAKMPRVTSMNTTVRFERPMCDLVKIIFKKKIKSRENNRSQNWARFTRLHCKFLQAEQQH